MKPRALLLHATKNTNKPADGAEFVAQAKRCEEYLADHHGFDVVRVGFDNGIANLKRRAIIVEQTIARVGLSGRFAHVAFFGHGLKRSIQTGHFVEVEGLPMPGRSVVDLATVFSSCVSRETSFVFYACDAARDLDAQTKDDLGEGPGGEGGFADRFRDALTSCGFGSHVDAHPSSGHTTRNPYVRRFHCNPYVMDDGGSWIVAPASPLFRRWRNALRTDFAFRFPLLSEREILEAVEATPIT